MNLKRIKVTASLKLHSGHVQLSKDQIKTRLFALKLVDEKSGIYAIVQQISFKEGEEFCYDGDIPKALADIVADAKSGETFAEIAEKNKRAAAKKAAVDE